MDNLGLYLAEQIKKGNRLMNTDKVIAQYSRKVEVPSLFRELVQLVLGGLF